MSARVVLITGCSEGGIGYTLAKKFADAGNTVYATARNVDKMQGLLGHSGIELLALDVLSEENAQQVVKHVIDKSGRIDILVNNAGMACFGPILEVPIEQIKNVYDTNVFSVLRMSRHVVPHMAARKSGLILNIGSIVGESPTPWAGVYASSKAAMHAVTEVILMECKPFDIKVMLVSPGGVQTNIANNSAPQFKLGPDTLYQKYLDNIVARMWASQAPGSLKVDDFADQVVKKALATSPPPYIALGSNVVAFTILKWLPKSWVHGYMWKRFATTKPVAAK